MAVVNALIIEAQKSMLSTFTTAATVDNTYYLDEDIRMRLSEKASTRIIIIVAVVVVLVPRVLSYVLRSMSPC